MDVAKKIELIEWLAGLQDESLLLKIDQLRAMSREQLYLSRTPKTSEQLEEKLAQSREEIRTGHVQTHEDVVAYFKARFSSEKSQSDLVNRRTVGP
jgi:hypothetical protein